MTSYSLLYFCCTITWRRGSSSHRFLFQLSNGILFIPLHECPFESSANPSPPANYQPPSFHSSHARRFLSTAEQKASEKRPNRLHCCFASFLSPTIECGSIRATSKFPHAINSSLRPASIVPSRLNLLRRHYRVSEQLLCSCRAPSSFDKPTSNQHSLDLSPHELQTGANHQDVAGPSHARN